MKIFKRLAIILMLVVSFVVIPSVKALTKGYITGDTVLFRSGAGTNFSSLATLNTGDEVIFNSTNKVDGPGCTVGWYSLTFNNKKGYVCSSYVSMSRPNSEDISYNRPWTSPKKAIFGGAEFISDGYINAGQFTSYLKKFNVNPNSDYQLFNHQYMTNIAAPCSEAYSSFISYEENNLLSLPLEFTIPIFNNMPDATKHPTDSAPKKNTTKVTDKNFEKKLDAEGFPESYKTWLRELHNKYPNWTFKSLKTGIDFNNAVSVENTVAAINGCSSCYQQPLVQTEPGWYRPNKATMEYYIDPRNFLDEDSILMFENLKYSSNHTTKVVQSILNGTFMSGNDPVDKLSYAQIFVDAGKTYDVSPVYLASLSRQEMGTRSGIANSGERFTYQGATYEGFYNFFNIGAYSSESNPVLAGLVYAAAGSSRNAEGVFAGSSSNQTVNGNANQSKPNVNESKPVVKPQENVVKETATATHLTNMNLNRKGNMVTNFSVGQTVSDLKKKTNAGEVTIKNANGTVVGDSEAVGTGYTMTFKNGETVTIVVYGDLNGDGKINSADLLKMRLALLKKANLSGAYLESAHVQNISGDINSGDLLRLRLHLLGKKLINQS